jgi:hypothetical protein
MVKHSIQKRHFKAVAKLLHTLRQDPLANDGQTLDNVANGLCPLFKSFNPAFIAGMFLDDCNGVGDDA